MVHGSSLPVSTVQYISLSLRLFLLRVWRSLITPNHFSSSSLISALTLWEHDNSLTIALDVCKAFFGPIEFLITFFPGPGSCYNSPLVLLRLVSPAYLRVPAQQRRLRELQARVIAAEAASRYISLNSVPTPIGILTLSQFIQIRPRDITKTFIWTKILHKSKTSKFTKKNCLDQLLVLNF